MRPCLLPFTSRPLTAEESATAAKWMPLLHREAGKRAKSKAEREELIAAFVPALLRCVMRFDGARGTGYQALLTRAFANAYVDYLRKLKTGSRHQSAPDWVFDRAGLHEPALQWSLDAKPEEPDAIQPPTPIELARQAVRTALTLGHTYRQAAEAARPHLGKAASLGFVAKTGRGLSLARSAGRPTCDTPALRAAVAAAGPMARRAREIQVCRNTFRKWSKMFTGSVRRDGASRHVHLSVITQQPKFDRSRVAAVLALRGEAIKTVSADLDISDSHLHMLLRGGCKVRPELLAKLRQRFTPDQWRFMICESDTLDARPKAVL